VTADGSSSSTTWPSTARRRLVERDRDARPRPPRHDARRRVGGALAARLHAHDAAHADARAPERPPVAVGVGDERPPGEPGLLDGLDAGQRQPARGALGGREAVAGVGVARPLLVALGIEQAAEPRQVRREVQGGSLFPAGAGAAT
jgi:hypothetical protein